MTRSLSSIKLDIANFEPVEGSWLGLESLLEELWKSGKANQAIPELLSVFERHPEDQGSGVAWSILHGLESLPGYEPLLIRSVDQKPSELGIIMIGRLLNAGVGEVDGIALLDKLQCLAATATLAPSLQKTARLFAEKVR